MEKYRLTRLGRIVVWSMISLITVISLGLFFDLSVAGIKNKGAFIGYGEIKNISIIRGKTSEIPKSLNAINKHSVFAASKMASYLTVKEASSKRTVGATTKSSIRIIEEKNKAVDRGVSTTESSITQKKPKALITDKTNERDKKASLNIIKSTNGINFKNNMYNSIEGKLDLGFTQLLNLKNVSNNTSINEQRKIAPKRVTIFYSPHPDDEVLSMGMAIADSVNNGDEVHVVLLSHGYDSEAIKIINGEAYCKWHQRMHNPSKEGYSKLSKQELGSARVKEFINSCEALGVRRENIHICNFDLDKVTPYEMKLVILGFEKQYNEALHCTSSYHDSHPFHRVLGETLLDLYNEKLIKNAIFYISPVQWKTVKGTYLMDVDLEPKVMEALNEYKKWNPSQGEFGVGYHSYPIPFSVDENKLNSKYNNPNQ